jgi:hypothetical protein
MLQTDQMVVATPAGFEPATFSLEGHQESPLEQCGLTHFQRKKYR